jgi:hypothetical protein
VNHALAHWPNPSHPSQQDASLDAAYQALWHFGSDDPRHQQTDPFYLDMQIEVLKHIAGYLRHGETLPVDVLTAYQQWAQHNTPQTFHHNSWYDTLVWGLAKGCQDLFGQMLTVVQQSAGQGKPLTAQRTKSVGAFSPLQSVTVVQQESREEQPMLHVNTQPVSRRLAQQPFPSSFPPPSSSLPPSEALSPSVLSGVASRMAPATPTFVPPRTVSQPHVSPRIGIDSFPSLRTPPPVQSPTPTRTPSTPPPQPVSTPPLPTASPAAFGRWFQQPMTVEPPVSPVAVPRQVAPSMRAEQPFAGLPNPQASVIRLEQW